ncbi:MAG: transposase [Candidatus Paceibacterota bacterium]
MRRPDIALHTYHHIVLRGARGMAYLHRQADWWHCAQLLYYLNDSHSIRNWKRSVTKQNKNPFHWLEEWPVRDPITSVLAFALHKNHLHIILNETREGGISEFMQRFGDSMSKSYNQRFGGAGTIFQGPYKSRLIKTDADMRNVGLYVMAKNVMERYPKGGIKGAAMSFTNAIKWATADSFSSFPEYAGGRHSPIVEPDVLKTVYGTPDQFIKDAQDYITHYTERTNSLGDLALE